jgi:hypothetical protein
MALSDINLTEIEEHAISEIRTKTTLLVIIALKW